MFKNIFSNHKKDLIKKTINLDKMEIVVKITQNAVRIFKY